MAIAHVAAKALNEVTSSAYVDSSALLIEGINGWHPWKR